MEYWFGITDFLDGASHKFIYLFLYSAYIEAF